MTSEPVTLPDDFIKEILHRAIANGFENWVGESLWEWVTAHPESGINWWTGEVAPRPEAHA